MRDFRSESVHTPDEFRPPYQSNSKTFWYVKVKFKQVRRRTACIWTWLAWFYLASKHYRSCGSDSCETTSEAVVLDVQFLFLDFLVLAYCIVIGKCWVNWSLDLLLFAAIQECLRCEVCHNETDERYNSVNNQSRIDNGFGCVVVYILGHFEQLRKMFHLWGAGFFNFEGQSMEERHRILAFDLL